MNGQEARGEFAFSLVDSGGSLGTFISIRNLCFLHTKVFLGQLVERSIDTLHGFFGGPALR